MQETIIIIVSTFVLFGAIVFLAKYTKKQRAKLKAEKERQEAERMEKRLREAQFKELEASILKDLGVSNWSVFPTHDESVIVKSRQTLEKYDYIKYFKEDKARFEAVQKVLDYKISMAEKLQAIIKSDNYTSNPVCNILEQQVYPMLKTADVYKIKIKYLSPSTGNPLGIRYLEIPKSLIEDLKKDPSSILSKNEYNNLIKAQQKEALAQKQKKYYDVVNSVIDYANRNKNLLVIYEDQKELDRLVEKLFSKAINSIKNIKTTDSQDINALAVRDYTKQVKADMDTIILRNRQLIQYYNSEEFKKIKRTCDSLMVSQKDFNDYINQKAKSISKLFGTRIVRAETVNNDEYQYIRPYKKTVTPFTAEVTSQVFSSAENSPMEYIVKYFYPNKELYPEQIRNLQTLIEELETLKEAKAIIERYKLDYQTYLNDVPDYIMQLDESGFYHRLGFANIDEEVLIIEYKFSYTSNGGMVQRSFSVPMTEENVAELIKILESKLTYTAFKKEQRALMTKKLRDFIKQRDNFTCCECGNSIYKEPNLLLEVDHILPIAKGGLTEEENLQTLCWKCNRSKGAKIA